MRPQVIDPPSWTKLGLVYDAALHRSPWALHSALTPTPIIKRDGNLRVFAGFRDNSGVSRIGWVDLDRSDPARIVGIAERPALDIGRDGCFDDNGVILGDIVSVGGVFHLFYVGFQLVAKAKFLAFTGLAVSDDEGEHFERVSDSPVLDRGPGECMFAAVHTVRHEDGLWRFWFGGGDGFVQIGGRPMPSYGVGYVESDDPCQIVGSRQRCLQPVAPEYRIGRPRVFRIGAEYRMICTAGTLTGSYLPVQAASVDGRIWTRDESPFALRRSASGWDSRHLAYGASSDDAARAAGVSPAVGSRWFRESGGMALVNLAPPSGRYLSFGERDEIAILRARGCGVCEIARRVGRSPSTISRELRRNASTRGGRVEYRATAAQWHADRRAKRPKTAKLAGNDVLRRYVQERLAGLVATPDGVAVVGPPVGWVGRRHGRRKDRRWARSWSPEQIANRLKVDFPDDESMRISHEAIYQSLYIQGRGALRRELTACLRTGRALRVPRERTRGRGKNFIGPEVMISERPAEADDRAVPGHWEGDLILGLDSSAIGTLVERTTRFTMLLHLPRMAGHGEARVRNGPALAGHGAKAVRDAIVASITTLPEQLCRSLTWDQGAEMAQHAELRIATGLEIYFCDPHSPWQRATNENTNGLLRQYFPKGTDLCRHSTDDLAAVAEALNSRPRKALGWKTPAEALNEYLGSLQHGGAATSR